MVGISSQPVRQLQALAALLAVAVFALTACSSGQTSNGSTLGRVKKSGTLTIAYLQKQGDQQYFIDEATGAQQQATTMGNVKIDVVNLGTDSNKAISELNAMIGQKVDGIVITVPDQKIGPQVIQAAQNAGIPLLASDDPIQSGESKSAPFVGFDSVQMGTKVGQDAGTLYKQAGWTSADTRIMAAYSQGLSDCQQREQGEEAGFKTVAGTLPQIVKLGTDNSNVDAQNKAGAALTANPGVKHWVVWGCNDESETGEVSALQNGHVPASNIIGVGLGAYLTCKDWKAGVSSGNKAALFISGNAVGHNTVRVMVNALRNGAPLPATTIVPTQMVGPSNWKAAMGSCT